MELLNIEVKNFRAISPAGVKVSFTQRAVALVGKNNSGKSSILMALNLLVNGVDATTRFPDLRDFNDDKLPITISIEIGDVPDWQFHNFLSLNCDEQPPAQPTAGIIEFSCIIHAPSLRNLGRTDLADQIEFSYSESAPERLSVIGVGRAGAERVTQLLHQFVRGLYIPAIRAANMIEDSLLEAQLDQLLWNLLFSGEGGSVRAREIDRVHSKWTKTLAKHRILLESRGIKGPESGMVHLSMNGLSGGRELLRRLSVLHASGGREEFWEELGHGSQNIIIIELLRLFLETKSHFNIQLLMLEEPEAFLHPHSQRAVADSLKPNRMGAMKYALLTSHSPVVISGLALTDIVRLENEHGARDGARAFQVTRNTAERFWDEKLPWKECHELFFANQVLFVEGPSDNRVLSGIARLIVRDESSRSRSHDLDLNGVTVLACDGNTSWQKVVAVAQDLGLRWSIVTDLDSLSIPRKLAELLEVAGLAGLENLTGEEQIQQLKSAGVWVWSRGSIESYYPAEIRGGKPRLNHKEKREMSKLFLAHVGNSSRRVPREMRQMIRWIYRD